MLMECIMHECLKKLLGNMENPEEEEVESLFQLLRTVGRVLDVPKAHAHMGIYFQRMQNSARARTPVLVCNSLFRSWGSSPTPAHGTHGMEALQESRARPLQADIEQAAGTKVMGQLALLTEVLKSSTMLPPPWSVRESPELPPSHIDSFLSPWQPLSLEIGPLSLSPKVGEDIAKAMSAWKDL
ncbi:hypothetical protein BKA83DRAFT_4491980 [Pisolithus microcarpus]|nr:hypothetical protein BKA83DRAFT_4491980 [Pisolithus microcarpus]